MIAVLPMWILGVPVVLALIDLIATRSAGRGEVENEAARGRHAGKSGALHRGEESSAVIGQRQLALALARTRPNDISVSAS
jgi:hypothetical protein